MIYGYHPFFSMDGKSLEILVDKILNGNLVIPARQYDSYWRKTPVPEECRNLLSRMLDPNPAKRCSLAEIVENPWFRADMPAGFDAYIQT